MQRYFAQNFAEQLVLDEVTSKHISSVMRNNVGDNIFLCIDKVYYEYEITSIDKKSVSCKLVKSLDVDNENKVKTTLVIPILKKDNHKVSIQKAIELGANEIILYQGDNTVVKWKDVDKKIEKLQQYVVDACRQSFRNEVVNISFKKLSDINISEYDVKLFGDETQNSISDFNISTDNKVLFISGCEGGFSPKEYEFFKSNEIQAVSLAKTILRAETAPIAFQSIITFLNK